MSRILIKNINELLQAGENIPKVLIGEQMKTVERIQNAFLAIEDGVVVEYGAMTDLEGVSDWSNLEIIDATGKLVMPAFCDAHTHLVFAKSREEEFVDRIKGLTYEEIALKGGGILNSAKKIAEADEETLYHDALNRIKLVMETGTGAIEIKSGYGLSVESELKMLRVIKRLKIEAPIEIRSTFLGAHAIPTAFKTNRKEYVNLIIEEMLPQIAAENLADYIDVFCEKNYFSIEEMKQIIEAGMSYGLQAKVHVNQFNILGGVKAATALNARSVDHLEYINEEDIKALKDSDCMPTLLPSCSYFLGIPFADARKIIDSDLPVALASDFNPGSTPSGNLGFVWSLACVKLKMTPEEALNALTVNAAYAMGLSDSHGKIALGKRCPVLITKEIPNLAYIPYAFGENHIERLILPNKK
jgi:imidazolonepropionase